VAPEAERVRTRDVDVRSVAGFVRDVVEVAVRVGIVVVDRRRELPVAHGEHREHRFDRAGGAEAVPRRPLRRRDRRLASVLLAERELQDTRLARVSERRRRRVRVHVPDLARVDARILESHRHGARGILAGRIRFGHVRRVGGNPIAHELRVDLRATCLRVAELLEDEHGTCFAHHEPVARLIEGP
jgi:hypothetical protein